jgi:hypothetical protein
VTDENGLVQIEALVHFYFNEEPKTIDRLAQLWNRLRFVLEFKGELNTKEINIG